MKIYSLKLRLLSLLFLITSQNVNKQIYLAYLNSMTDTDNLKIATLILNYLDTNKQKHTNNYLPIKQVKLMGLKT